MSRDLTRWNRAGLARVRYADANAAVLLERLRARLASDFPDWPAAVPEDGTDPRAAMEALYARDPDDLLWQLNRAFARAAHVLLEATDAVANEGWIGTATQWESLRRLTAMLDYAPHPPASAFTELAVDFKPGAAGLLAAGFQLKHTPPEGGKPILFETLAALEGDAALNALRPAGWDRNPLRLSGARFTLAGRFDKLESGKPLVLEDERDGHLQAHLVVGVDSGEDTTTVYLAPPVSRADGYLRGHTLFHLLPKDKLAARSPRTTGAVVGRSLRMAGSLEGLAAGDLVAIGRPGAKPRYRRVKAVQAEHLVFHAPLGEVDLAEASVMTPIEVPIAHLGGNSRSIDPPTTPPPRPGWQIRTLFVAGDWSWLSGRWLADIRHEGNPLREYLPVYECVNADYFPPSGASQRLQPLAGYTAVTLAWSPDHDDADTSIDLSLQNPQALLVAPRTPGPWRPDTFLQKSEEGRLSEPLVVAQPGKLAPGDLAVVTRGGCLAWARLRHVGVDAEDALARLETVDGWHDRGDGPFYLASTRVFGHFTSVARLADANVNTTPLADSRIDLETLPEALVVGRAVVVEGGGSAVTSQVTEREASGEAPWLRLADPPPTGSTAGNLSIAANVVLAGHGETRPLKLLGSGNGALNRQRFLLDVNDASFVADPIMPTGVRADLQVTVAGEIWRQRASLRDSGPADSDYQVRQTEDGTLWIEFGDGRHGRRLPTGSNNVAVRYRQGAGAAGNLAAGLLVKPVHPDPLVAAVRQPMPASGGGERESVDGLRDNAPRALLALERAVSLSDFAALAQANAGVAQAAAFAAQAGLGQREQVEVVVVPAGGGSFTPALAASLEAFLAAHTLPGVSVTVQPFEPVRVELQVTVRIRPEAFLADAVAGDVAAALAEALSLARRKLAQALHRGEVFALVDGVTGVENSDVLLVLSTADAARAARVVRDADGRIRAVHATPRQCIHVADMAAVRVTVEDFAL
ncbi:MAG: putative baseplate assembly protein [Rhodocyclaceae bacterium]|nr:putative baseplate assembly protein [Rhodocyclaceae bacterium]